MGAPKKMYIRCTLKQDYILKHALRDKSNRDSDEQKLYEDITDEIQAFKARYKIPDVSPDKHFLSKGGVE